MADEAKKKASVGLMTDYIIQKQPLLNSSIDIVNVACNIVEKQGKQEGLKGSQKQQRAVELIQSSLDGLHKNGVLPDSIYEDAIANLDKVEKIQSSITSVIALWNQFRKTSCFKKIFTCKCCL